MLLSDNSDSAKVSEALPYIANAEKSIGQKDSSADLSVTTGFFSEAWKKLYPDKPIPVGLKNLRK